MPYTIDPLTEGCYPGTTVLINKFDLRDAAKLRKPRRALFP